MNDAFFVDGESMTRIARAVREFEKGSLIPHTNDDRTPTAPVQILRITGDVDPASGLHPAAIYGYVHQGDGSGTYNLIIEDVRVRALNGEVYAENDEILGRFSGAEDGGPLGVFVATGGGEFVRWLRVIEATASGSGSTWRCYMQRPTLPPPSTTYTDGVECRLKLIAGETFQNGKYYLGTLNGVTDGKPLFHAAGEKIFILNTCDAEGTPICDKWYMHSNFTIVENVDCETGAPL
jgi:hypothetical protein